MNFLMDKYKENVSKLKTNKSKVDYEPDISYPTGFLPFDFYNAETCRGYNPETKEIYDYISPGIADGSITTFFGRSSSGKTTIMIQMAANIIRNFPNGVIYHEDCERAFRLPRKHVLTRFTDEEIENKYIHRNNDITIESTYERIRMIYNMKMDNRKELLYNTGRYDMKGNPIYKLQPTVVLIDSIPMLLPAKFTEEEEIAGNMAAPAQVRAISALLKRLLPMLKSANIMLFIINHINPKVSTSIFPTKATLPFLKQDEHLPCGQVLQYLSNLMLRVDDHSKLKPSEGYGIAGSLVDLIFVKSRSAQTGDGITSVFDFKSGFDEDLSLLQFIKDNKLLSGAGANLYFNDPDFKFSQKTFKEKLRNDSDFRQSILTNIFPILKDMVPPYISEFDNSNSFSDMLLANL